VKIEILIVLFLVLSAVNIVRSNENGSLASSASFFFSVFTLCFFIGLIAIIAGTGGGVLFTSLFLGFTSVHPDIIRATGLLAAIAGTRIGARTYLRSIANIRIALLLGLPYTLFAVLGAFFGLYLTKHFGTFGIALIKLLLGFIVVGIGMAYIFVKRSEYPSITAVDSFTQKLGLEVPYFEQSIGKVVNYKLRHAWVAILLCCGVGFISGTFGLGAGWAIGPIINLIMSAPLKVATTTSAVIISIGDTAAIFPYFMSGSIIPIFAVPAVTGLMVGARVGSSVAVRIKARYIRYILVLILIFAGVRLIWVGLWMMV
jgi:hypothetical protein